MTDAEEITAIEYPRSNEQLGLLLMRWNALMKQDIAPRSSPELYHLTRILHDVGQQQRAYEQRKARLPPLNSATHAHADVSPQLAAFNLLSRNVDLPAELQQALVVAAGIKHPKHQQQQHQQQKHNFLETKKRRLGLVKDDKNLPVLGSAETIIRNRISHRLLELEQLASNLGTVNVRDAEIKAPDVPSQSEEALKLQAVLELKQLRILTKQKSLRQHVIYYLTAISNDSAKSTMFRYLNRRTKPQSSQDLQLTEQLDRQQRLAREQREKAAVKQLLDVAVNHAKNVATQIAAKNQRKGHFLRGVLQMHAVVQRDESRKAERTAKQRLQALRANDEEAYLKLLDQTKDTRITHLLRQTNQFLQGLTEAVKLQQAETGSAPEPELPSNADPNADESNVDYYQVAHRIKETVTQQPRLLIGGKLKEYQLRGLQWMVSLVNNNLNGILADEMGLGKTIQSISLIAYLLEVKRWSGPFLIIVPLSTITNWNVEFDKWAPSIKKIVYKGPPNARKAQQATIKYGNFQVLLTTYEYIIKDRPILSKIRWEHMIIDEGHRMKNTQSKLSQTLTQYYFSKYRLILTGTPLQNNLPELWALLNFVLPKIFNSVKTFDEWFNTPFANTGGQDRIELTEEETLLVIRRLHKVLRPFLLRRLKKDVEKDLPDKVEKVVKCKLSALQLKLYEHMLQHNMIFVGDNRTIGGNDTNSYRPTVKGLNNTIMQLRKICNHPYVFPEVESLINPERLSNDQLWRVSGKFELLDRILPKFKASGHRVLIFFQMTQVMNIMEDYMHWRGHRYLRLDGGTKAEDRSDLLKRFNEPDSPYFCFLLSTRAGGLGLNLQSADTVIIYDTDWNPFQDLQAQDRAHRIGQTKEVRILRLITDDSVEEAILDRALSKLDIDGKVIQAGRFDNKSTAEEQEQFLRNLLDSEEQRKEANPDDDMDEEELNEILARSDGERELFSKLDAERHEQESSNPLPRLFTEDELPEIYKRDIVEQLASEPVISRRERRRVAYDEMFEESDIDEDESPKPSRNKRSPAPSNGHSKRARTDSLSVEDREELTERANGVLEAMEQAVDDSSSPPRLLTGIFQELPLRKQYPDYYNLIKNPISLAEIRKKIKSASYMSLSEFKSDLQLMLDNARTYNMKGSFVYDDAESLQEILDRED